MQAEFPGVDPWGLRNEYIELAARPRLAGEEVRQFLENEGVERENLNHTRILQLLEMQRHALLMFTSCGWFFNDISGIETQQILLYAARAIELFEQGQQRNVEDEFIARLASAVSNLPQHQTGAAIYRNARDASQIELSDVAAHFAMYSLFEKPPQRQTLYVFRIDSKRHEVHQASAVRLVLGRVGVESLRTLQNDKFILAICHFGGHSFTCGVRSADTDEWPDFFEDLIVFLEKAELGELVRSMDQVFGKRLYSLRSLFGDEKERFLERLLNSAVEAVEEDYRRIYLRQAPLMRFLAEQSVDQPRTFLMAAEFTINAELIKALRGDTPQLDRISELLEEATSLNIPLENQKLSYEATRAIEGLALSFAEDPLKMEKLKQLIVALKRFEEMPIEFDVWTVQNLYFEVAERLSEDGNLQGPEISEKSTKQFRELGLLLHIADPRFVSLPARDFKPEGLLKE